MAVTDETHPVTRTLKVMEMVCPECSEIIGDGLSGLPGVQRVDSDWRRNKVTVTYDLYRVRAHEVEKLLADIGFPPHSSFPHRWMRDWIHFTEQNEVDNLQHVAHCCSRPPVGA